MLSKEQIAELERLHRSVGDKRQADRVQCKSHPYHGYVHAGFNFVGAFCLRDFTAMDISEHLVAFELHIVNIEGCVHCPAPTGSSWAGRPQILAQIQNCKYNRPICMAAYMDEFNARIADLTL